MANKPIIDVDLGPNNGTLKFFTVDEITTFLEGERQHWNWLGSSPVNGQFQQPWGLINKQLRTMEGQISTMGDGIDLGAAGIFENALEQAFRNLRIPISTSPIGQFIDELRGDTPIVAASALSSWMNTGGIDIGKFEHAKGVMLIAAFDANMTSKTPASVKRSLENLHKSFQEAKAKTERETGDQRETFKREMAYQRKILARSIRQARRRLSIFMDGKRERVDQTLSNLGDAAAETILSIRNTENLYREHMQLKGPVEYWSKKAVTHRAQTLVYRKWLIGFSVFASLALVGSLFWIGGHAIEIASAEKPPAVYLVLVTLGVVMTTIVFWAARILTRLFLSEHHLAIDADERAIMTQTYLALTAEKAATDEDRAIVLSSLFRPTADGIVKDDAAPDLSPASLLSRIGSR